MTRASSIQDTHAPGRGFIFSVKLPSSASKPGKISPSEVSLGVQTMRCLSLFTPSASPKVSPQLIRPSRLALILSVSAWSDSVGKLSDKLCIRFIQCFAGHRKPCSHTEIAIRTKKQVRLSQAPTHPSPGSVCGRKVQSYVGAETSQQSVHAPHPASQNDASAWIERTA